MEKSDYMLVFAVFFIAAAIGFAGHNMLKDDGFTKSMSVRVDQDNPEAVAKFDNKSLKLKHENYKQAKFYFVFNDTREEQLLEGLKHNGELQTVMKIRSFGNDTYLLYLRYRDSASKFDDGWMELYRVEKA